MAVRRLYPDQPPSFAFSPENLTWAKETIAKYPPGKQASAVLPVLWRAQEQNDGWLPEPAIRYVASRRFIPSSITFLRTVTSRGKRWSVWARARTRRWCRSGRTPTKISRQNCLKNFWKDSPKVIRPSQARRLGAPLRVQRAARRRCWTLRFLMVRQLARGRSGSPKLQKNQVVMQEEAVRR